MVKNTEVVNEPEVVEESLVSDDNNLIELCLKECFEINNELKSLQVKQLNKIKQLEKLMKKNLKLTNKMKKKKNRPKREPSGFAKPTKISEELCQFLKKPSGTEMARTEVTKYLTTYIKDNKLQFEQDKRVILPDPKLKKLLNVQKDDKVTYFNLQKFMKPHFVQASSSI